MRVFISADIEGCTGVVTWKQAGSPSAEHYDWAFARRMMTHDVTAAIEGARSSGATQIVVKDSHNTGKNLLVDELPPGITLISGAGAGDDGMMEGIAGGFDVAFLVGYHAMAGTQNGVMEHTITGRVHRFAVNGTQWGEIGISAATAAHYGVPIGMVVSDEAGCNEAKTVAPMIHTAVTKVGRGRYMADLASPDVTQQRIFSAAQAAVMNPGTPVAPLPEYILQLEMCATQEADAIAQLADWTRLDGYTCSWRGKDWPDAHVAARRAMAVGSRATGD